MLLNNVKKPLKDRTRIRFHIGTAELMANVRLLECEALEPGETSLAQLYLSEEAAAVWNQPFVVRSESPVMTIGGGRVLHPNSVLLNRPTDTDIRHGQAMRSGEPSQRAAASVYLAASADTNRGDGWQQSEWPRTAGVTQLDSVYQQLTDSKQLVELRLSQSRSLVVHCDRVSQIGDRIQKSLRRLHDQFPLRFSHPRNVVENEFSYLDQPVLLAAVIDHLKRQKLITANVNSIGLVGRGPKLSKGQKQLLEWLTTQVKEAGLQGPTAKALEKSATKNKDSVEELLSMAVENGDMIKLMPTGFHISTSAFSEAKDSLAHAMEGTDGLKVTEIGQLLGISRRWSVPICEYLDETGFTKRIDDRRVLNTPSLTVS